MPGIETLSLQQNHFSDKGLLRLAGEDRLKRLYVGLGDGRITDAGLTHLEDFKKLEILDVQKSDVTVRGLERLKCLPNLKELWLSDRTGTEADKRALRQMMPGLKIR